MTLAVSQVVDAAVLRAPGERHDGKRELLGVSVALSEAGVNRRKFITDLKDRGMHGMQLFVSDDHAGPKAAVFTAAATLPGFHLQQTGAYVPRLDMREASPPTSGQIFNAPDEQEGERLLERFMDPAPVQGTVWTSEAPQQGSAVCAPYAPRTPWSASTRESNDESGLPRSSPTGHPASGWSLPSHDDLRTVGHRQNLPQPE
ncbi:MAG: transposase [Pseudomonadota bacterium]|nr:transposase [Pseudomonadota bacterium]